MTVSGSSLAWFLEDSEDTKMYRAICNYLSLGQFELAGPLIRMHHEAELRESDLKHSLTRVVNLLLGLVESGFPESWVPCSNSVSSTSHLHSMCIDLIEELVGNCDIVPEWYKLRCAFELRLTLALQESGIAHNLHVANELRQRFAVYLVDKFSLTPAVPICVPRLLILSNSSVDPQLLVIESTQPKSNDLNSTPLDSDCTEWIFDICRSSPNCGPPFLEILHSVSPLISVQLTHIQAALVCDAIIPKSLSRRSNLKRWKRACRNLRFLNDLNSVVTDMHSVNDFLLIDLFSLLVAICNCDDGFEIFSTEFVSSIEKLITDCLSPGYGAYPFIMSKKRRSLFNLSSISSDDRIKYNPNDNMRQFLYESLCATTHLTNFNSNSTNSSSFKSLLQSVGDLEDSLLILFAKKFPIAPCFLTNSLVPFWDLYFDFLRVSGNHCLEYPAKTAIDLIKNGDDMKSVRILLSPHFNQLKPLIVLLCWGSFHEDDTISRSALIEELWSSYLSSESKSTQFKLVEQSVSDLVHHFGLAKLAAESTESVKSRNVLDIMAKLRNQSSSFIGVIRSALLSISDSQDFFKRLENVASPSNRLTDLTEHDLDFARVYFALRQTVALMISSSVPSSSPPPPPPPPPQPTVNLTILNSLCESITNKNVRTKLLLAILSLIFSHKSNSSYKIQMNSLISLLCLVCYHIEQFNDHNRMAKVFLLKFLLALRQSMIALKTNFSTDKQTISSVLEWVSLIPGADTELASQCDDALVLPSVKYSAQEEPDNLTPPFGSMRIDKAAEFIPRLMSMDLIATALELNDYELAEDLVKFLDRADSASFVEEAKIFAKLRSSGTMDVGEQDQEEDPTVLIDLSISGNASTAQSLDLLQKAHHRLVSGDTRKISPPNALVSWSNKLLVLLEAKTQLNGENLSKSNDNENDDNRMKLSELILGIETLPNEPELLKDHLSRMHTQRSAIMSLVDRVDRFRRTTEETADDVSPENTGSNLDFLADAIKTLDEVVGGGNEASQTKASSFLIKFLEYLNRVCSLIQDAATISSVSFFSVLSERPVDLVAKLVFVHHGIPQAIDLCDIMGLDIIDVILDHSVSITESRDEEKYCGGKFFISIDILNALASTGKLPRSRIVGIALERRSELWPSSAILDFASSGDSRINSWKRFVVSFQVLTGKDVSEGFTMAQENDLDPEMRIALRSVHSESPESMDALCRMAARALMLERQYILALAELDTNLHVCNETLLNEALMGCLHHCTDLLTPQNIYELLWRVPDPSTLVQLVKKFYRLWDARIATKSLELCVERLSNKDPDSETFVLHSIRVIRVMDKVSCSVPAHGVWQVLDDMVDVPQCIQVIRDLLVKQEHGLADEFLNLKSKILVTQVDALSDEIELSRLGSMWKQQDRLLERLQTFHHPLKASRLAVQLISSINVIPNRIVLTQLVLSNGIACEEDEGALETELASLALFALLESSLLRPEWKNLLGRPDLVFESLLMNGITAGIGNWLNQFRSWRNDSLLLRLARRAILLDSITTDHNPLNSPEETLLDIGLGGPWSLTGDESIDIRIRSMHQNALRKPNMNLAMKFLNLSSGDSKMNANSIFDLADDLSLFLHNFIARDSQIVFSKSNCPFSRPSFVRQAIIGLLDLLAHHFSRAIKPQLAQHGISNIDLIIDIWTRVGIQVGLKGLSNVTIQMQLRDALIKADALDLAERVCYALGRDRPGAYEAADVVNMERVKLAIRVGDLEAARNHAKKFNSQTLSIIQLEEIELALTERSKHVPLVDLEEAAKLHAFSFIQRRIGDDETVLIPQKLSLRAKQLLPAKFFEPTKTERFSLLSRIVENGEDEEVVVIETPKALSSWTGEGSGDCDVKNSHSMSELLYYCSAHGEIGTDVYFLIKAGQVAEAIESGVAAGMQPRSFVATVSGAISPDSNVWLKILSVITAGNSKTYLTACETYLRSVCAYTQLYPFEVAMGREAHAAVVCVHLYLRAARWEEKLGHLESCRGHLETCWTRRKFSRRLRRRDVAGEDHSGGDGSDDSDDFFHHVPPSRITLPFTLPMSELGDDAAIPDTTIQSLQTLVDLQLEVCRLMPSCAPSASLFGSIQSVSELIDYLLMDGHVAVAKRIIGKINLPDSALCGIFDDI